jgi:hypothetical protein
MVVKKNHFGNLILENGIVEYISVVWTKKF